jgi:hypothetical protein
MLAYTAFINSILFQPNPNQNLDRTLPATFRRGNPIAGREVFLTVPQTKPGPTTCNFCHKITPGPGTNRVIISAEELPQPLKIPHLRNMYQKVGFNRFAGTTIDGFGMDHDGHVSTFLDFFAANAFSGYTDQQQIDMTAFMMTFDTGTAPAVGYTITLTPENASVEQLQADWTTLQQQSVARNIDVVVRGTISGQVRALLYRPVFDDYAVDGFPGVTVTRAQLQGLIESGDTLSVMGVPPREGISPAGGAAPPSAPASDDHRGTSRGH